MARFKTLKQKDKKYIFSFLENRQDKNPAIAVFARFPLPNESFMPKAKHSVFDGIDLGKLSKKNNTEMDKFLSAFMDHFTSNMTKVDYEYFVRECIDHFENFESDDKEIISVDDFLALNIEMRTLIAHDCYLFAQEKDEFTMGESAAL